MRKVALRAESASLIKQLWGAGDVRWHPVSPDTASQPVAHRSREGPVHAAGSTEPAGVQPSRHTLEQDRASHCKGRWIRHSGQGEGGGGDTVVKQDTYRASLSFGEHSQMAHMKHSHTHTSREHIQHLPPHPCPHRPGPRCCSSEKDTRPQQQRELGECESVRHKDVVGMQWRGAHAQQTRELVQHTVQARHSWIVHVRYERAVITSVPKAIT